MAEAKKVVVPVGRQDPLAAPLPALDHPLVGLPPLSGAEWAAAGVALLIR
jgi:hypothetical protein